jgi:ribonucleoside-diphosphate reductase subunit M2
MFNPNEEGPISPMKKLKILSEKQNVPQQVLSTIAFKKQLIVEEPVQPEVHQEENTNDHIEPLLKETINQYVIFPINHDDMWSMYKASVDNFWSPTESLNQLEKLNLNPSERQFMKYFSSIFASPNSRGYVNDNLAEHFCSVIQVTEAKFFYGHQLFVQNIHYEMYNQMLDSFASEPSEKERLFKIVESWDSVVSKREWLRQWETKSFAEQLVGAACLHGLMFTSLNLLHSWLENKMRSSMGHELVDTIAKMIIDQGLQRDFACLMVSHLRDKPAKEAILAHINKSAKIEFDFLLNGIKSNELIELDTGDIINLIDVNTKALKNKLFNSFENTRKKINTDTENKAHDKNMNRDNQENQTSYKENAQKICFDEDF